MTAHLLLIRGLPGSGKSTMAQSMKAYLHIEADQFFMFGGLYLFEAGKLREAHDWCQKYTRHNLLCGLNVVVANTFTRKWEMQPYLDMGFRVDVITACGEFESVHKVPHTVIEAMRSRWEAYP